jgi:hypothetical protein
MDFISVHTRCGMCSTQNPQTCPKGIKMWLIISFKGSWLSVARRHFNPRDERLGIIRGSGGVHTRKKHFTVPRYIERKSSKAILHFTIETDSCRNCLAQRFSNFFQVGTTFISRNVLRTTLILSA